MTTQPEPWLRGPLPGIPSVLQPAAHAFVMAREDVELAVQGVTHEQLWRSPGGITPLGFHLAHLTGSTDRLLTYARGETLSAAQKEALSREKTLVETQPALQELLDAWRRAVDAALAQLAATPESTVAEARAVGRAQLPTTVLGLLFHAAEHASRHTGQVVTTARMVKNG
jgi:hypothetical protein